MKKGRRIVLKLVVIAAMITFVIYGKWILEHFPGTYIFKGLTFYESENYRNEYILELTQIQEEAQNDLYQNRPDKDEIRKLQTPHSMFYWVKFLANEHQVIYSNLNEEELAVMGGSNTISSWVHYYCYDSNSQTISATMDNMRNYFPNALLDADGNPCVFEIRSGYSGESLLKFSDRAALAVEWQKGVWWFFSLLILDGIIVIAGVRALSVSFMREGSECYPHKWLGKIYLEFHFLLSIAASYYVYVKFIQYAFTQAALLEIYIAADIIIIYCIWHSFYYRILWHCQHGKWSEYSLFVKFYERIKKLISNIRSVYVWIPGVIIWTYAHFLIISMKNAFFNGCLIIVDFFMCLYILLRLIEIKKIGKAIEMIADGELSVSVEKTSRMFQNMADNVNRIRDGFSAAVQEQIRSERLKTELITNISHDLKTPLTSIINYVQLLKKKNLKDSSVQKYIEVLDKKSLQLKTLTDDLIDVSKLISGNEEVNFEMLNFAEIVMQANGEFAEKFDEKKLELRSHIDSEEMMAEIDGKKMWRVMENLYHNIYKYAMEGTRVYVELKKTEENSLLFTIKNVSKVELDQSADMLMERFIRGDESRNTEGSGLGLGIAKELIELQAGNFSIDVQGDLFIASIELPGAES